MRALGAGLFGIVMLLACAGAARGDVAISAQLGFGNYYRLGRWTPLFVTLSDPAGPREAEISIYDPLGPQYAMQVKQVLALNPTAITVPLYAPLSNNLEETTLTVRDAKNGHFLGQLKLRDADMMGGRAPSTVNSDDLFIGLSGSAESARLVSGQFGSGDEIAVGYLPPDHLPAAAIGYDALDVLMLNQPDFNQIDVDQQRAIVQWVRSGGLLVIWPGAAPLAASSPILDVLPCRLGENTVYDLPIARLKREGLASRFAHLKGRTVGDVANDARMSQLFGSDAIHSYRRWVGLGQVMVIPADLSSLMFHDAKQGRTFWRETLRGMIDVPAPRQEQNTYAYYGNGQDARQVRAMRTSMNWLATIPGAGQFGFAYVAGVLVGLMIVVGPVDWFVLKRLHRQPWTWVTTSGWIGLVTFGAIFAGHLFRSGDVEFRTVSLVDEADGARVAAIDLAAVYSPQTSRYELTVNPDGWWAPANESNFNFRSSGLATEIEFDQDYHGNRPMPMLINVWNLRLLMGNDYESAPPTITGKLTQSGGIISGAITNNSKATLKQIVIRAHGGIARLDQEIAPGATLKINKGLNAADQSFASSKPTKEQWGQVANVDIGGPPTFPFEGEMSTQRSDRIAQMIADRGDVCCVYAISDAPPARVKLNDPTAKAAHLCFVRSVLSIESAEGK